MLRPRGEAGIEAGEGRLFTSQSSISRAEKGPVDGVRILLPNFLDKYFELVSGS